VLLDLGDFVFGQFRSWLCKKLLDLCVDHVGDV
jgi:hypothetical protein